MNCADVEILLADYVDKTLAAEQVSALEAHLAGCAACAELARDVGAAAAFIEKAAAVEPPPELINKLIFEITQGPSRAVVKPSLGRRLFGRWFDAALQPRMAMGMAMTVLSLGMMLRFEPIQARDLDPVELWHSAQDRVTRMWDRAVKYYDSLQVVVGIRSRYDEWLKQKGTDRTGGPAQGATGGETK
jgi:hypothetical protein